MHTQKNIHLTLSQTYTHAHRCTHTQHARAHTHTQVHTHNHTCMHTLIYKHTHMHTMKYLGSLGINSGWSNQGVYWYLSATHKSTHAQQWCASVISPTLIGFRTMQLIRKFSVTLCPCQLNHQINDARRQQDCSSSTSLSVVGFQGNRDHPW